MVNQDLIKLIEFVQGRLSFEEWVEADLNRQEPEVNLADMPDETRSHENKHAQAWWRHGVKTSFHRSREGYYYTEPNSGDVVNLYQRVGRDALIDIFRGVVAAPVTDPSELESTDKRQWLILSGRIKNEDELLAYRLGQLKS